MIERLHTQSAWLVTSSLLQESPHPFFIDIIIAFVILIGAHVMQDYEIIPRGGKSKKPGKTSKDKDKSGEKSSKSEKHGRKEKKHKRYELLMLRE